MRFACSLLVLAYLFCFNCRIVKCDSLFSGDAGSIDYTIEDDGLFITITGDIAKEVSVFSVESPDRLVIDLQKVKIPLPKVSSDISASCISKIRFGVHKEKFRIVLDRTEVPCVYARNKVDGGLKVSLKPSSPSTPTPVTHAPTASVSTIAPHTPTVTPPVAVTTPAPAVLPTLNPTIITTPTATALPVMPSPAPSLTASSEVQEGRTLQSINFEKEGDKPIIKLQLSERANFKLVRDDTRQYRISIADCAVGQEGLLLPQFPPNDMVGFTLVKATKGEGKVEIIIGLDDGMKASAVNKDTAIVISAEPAGF